jgi:hypothetical protein
MEAVRSRTAVHCRRERSCAVEGYERSDANDEGRDKRGAVLPKSRLPPAACFDAANPLRTYRRQVRLRVCVARRRSECSFGWRIDDQVKMSDGTMAVEDCAAPVNKTAAWKLNDVMRTKIHTHTYVLD